MTTPDSQPSAVSITATSRHTTISTADRSVTLHIGSDDHRVRQLLHSDGSNETVALAIIAAAFTHPTDTGSPDS